MINTRPPDLKFTGPTQNHLPGPVVQCKIQFLVLFPLTCRSAHEHYRILYEVNQPDLICSIKDNIQKCFNTYIDEPIELVSQYVDKDSAL